MAWHCIEVVRLLHELTASLSRNVEGLLARSATYRMHCSALCRDFRPSWELNLTEPIASNFYPLTGGHGVVAAGGLLFAAAHVGLLVWRLLLRGRDFASLLHLFAAAMYIQDDERQLALLTERAQGGRVLLLRACFFLSADSTLCLPCSSCCTLQPRLWSASRTVWLLFRLAAAGASLRSGQMEVMVHRRTMEGGLERVGCTSWLPGCTGRTEKVPVAVQQRKENLQVVRHDSTVYTLLTCCRRFQGCG